MAKLKEPGYQVRRKQGKFEVRDYGPMVLAQAEVRQDYDSAVRQGALMLWEYFFGSNRQGKSLELTAPLGQMKSEEGWVVSMAAPAGYTLESLPEPVEPALRLKQQAPSRAAVLRFKGGWSKRHFDRKVRQLLDWVAVQGFLAVGEPMLAVYNRPGSLPFFRRNEVLVELAA